MITSFIGFFKAFFEKKENLTYISDIRKFSFLPISVNNTQSSFDFKKKKHVKFFHHTAEFDDNIMINFRAKLWYLPNVCIRKDGVPVSYILLHLYGKFCHQFTAPEHRGKGLSTICEKELMKRMIRWVLLMPKFGRSKKMVRGEKSDFRASLSPTIRVLFPDFLTAKK